MKKKLALFSTFIVTGLMSYSQAGPFGTNAEWNYRVDRISEGGYAKYQYANDTIINGQNCQTIKFYHYGGNLTLPQTGNYYTYGKNDTVYWYNGTKFHMLYDFSANIGDSWVISIDEDTNTCTNDTSLVTVSDAGTIAYNGQNLRWIALETAGDDWRTKYFLNGKALEGVGMITESSNNYQSSLFPREGVALHNNCDSNLIVEYERHTFHCFSNDEFSYPNINGCNGFASVKELNQIDL